MYLKRPFVVIDGDAGDMTGKIQMNSIEDPRGDVKADADIYDLKRVSVGVHKGFLYISARFHNAIERNQRKTIVVHVYLAGQKQNFWIDFYSSSFSAVRRYADGTPLQKWQALSVPGMVKKKIRVGIRKDIELKIPLELFGQYRNLKNAKIKLIMGGTLKGKLNWNADGSAFFIIQ